MDMVGINDLHEHIAKPEQRY